MSDFRIEPSGDLAILITRSFTAPPARLAAAHLDPDTARKWLGSDDMPVTECRIDPTAGGASQYRWKMRDGTDMTLTGRFEKVTETCIVHHELFDPDWTDGETRVKTEFLEQDGRTMLRMMITYATPETRDRVITSGMAAGMQAAYDRLDALL
jgi:uncharacterized protein YndB with AHSA1/START domain